MLEIKNPKKINIIAKKRFHSWLSLIFPSALTAIITTTIVVIILYRYNQDSIRNLAYKVISKVDEQIETQLEIYMQTPINVSEDIEGAIDLGVLDIEDMGQLRKVFLREMRQHPEVIWITMGTEEPNYVDVVKEKNGNYISANWMDLGGIERVDLTPDGQIEKTLELLDTYDHRERGWYQDAKEKGDFYWTPVYKSINPEYLLLTANRPIYGPEGSFLGVLGVHVSLASIASFLENIEADQNGQVIIIERESKFLVGSSNKEMKAISRSADGLERVKIQDIENALLTDVAAYLEEQENSGETFQSPILKRVYLAGKNYFLQIHPYQNSQGLDWLTVTTIPESDLTDAAVINVPKSIFIIILTLLLSVGIAILFSREDPELKGGIVVKIPDEMQSQFHDLLKGFEDYAKLNGYTISFFVSRLMREKVFFGVDSIESTNSITSSKVRQDLVDYIRKVEAGEPLVDLPIILPDIEHQKLLWSLKNRISFLQYSCSIQKEVIQNYKKVIEKSICRSNLVQNIMIEGDMESRNYSVTNSPGSAIGQGNLTFDNQIEQTIEVVGSAVNWNEIKNVIYNKYGQTADEIVQLLASLQESVKAFPSEEKETARVLVKDLTNDLQEPEKLVPTKLKVRFMALLSVAIVVATHIATATDFANNVLELSEKLSIPAQTYQTQLDQLKQIRPDFDWPSPQ